ncbi:MAG: hypothetical protein ACLU4J_07315, partial [Butyricimonas paravirosa]
GRQQIVRIDYEQHLELSEKAREDFQTHLASLFQEFPTLVISDYGKGMISEELCSFLIKTAKSPVLSWTRKGKTGRNMQGQT